MTVVEGLGLRRVFTMPAGPVEAVRDVSIKDPPIATQADGYRATLAERKKRGQARTLTRKSLHGGRVVVSAWDHGPRCRRRGDGMLAARSREPEAT